MKPLYPSYELSWRTEEDEAFMRSGEWKKIRLRILKRDDYTCSYCGYRAEKYQQVNHIDGNPKNNDDSNLEVICPDCHKVMHSGLWAAVMKTMRFYSKSDYSQTDIVRITREMRGDGKKDEEIIKFLGLDGSMPWKQDLDYLRPLYAFNTSDAGKVSSKPLLTEEEQDKRLRNRNEW